MEGVASASIFLNDSTVLNAAALEYSTAVEVGGGDARSTGSRGVQMGVNGDW